MVLPAGHGDHKAVHGGLAQGGKRQAAPQRISHQRADRIAQLLVARGQAVVAHPAVGALGPYAHEHKVVREALRAAMQRLSLLLGF